MNPSKIRHNIQRQSCNGQVHEYFAAGIFSHLMSCRHRIRPISSARNKAYLPWSRTVIYDIEFEVHTLLYSTCVIMTRGRRPSLIIRIVSVIEYFPARFRQRSIQQRHLKIAIFEHYDVISQRGIFMPHDSCYNSKIVE